VRWGSVPGASRGGWGKTVPHLTLLSETAIQEHCHILFLFLVKRQPYCSSDIPLGRQQAMIVLQSQQYALVLTDTRLKFKRDLEYKLRVQTVRSNRQ